MGAGRPRAFDAIGRRNLSSLGRLNRPQRILEIGDEVVGVLHPDRDPHQIVGDAERLLARVGDRQMGHRRGRAGERLGAAEADRQIGDDQRVEERERLSFSALE